MTTTIYISREQLETLAARHGIRPVNDHAVGFTYLDLPETTYRTLCEKSPEPPAEVDPAPDNGPFSATELDYWANQDEERETKWRRGDC